MTTSIKLKKSSVSGKIPLSSDLDYGELAINYADGIIYYKNSSNEIKSFIDSDLINTTIDNKLAAAGVGDSAQILSLIQNNSVDSSEVIQLIDSDYIQSRQDIYDSIRFDSDFGTKTTTDLTEGSNLYFTTLRAHDAIATYDSDINTTGTITASFFSGDGSLLTDVRAEVLEEEVKNVSGGTLLKGTPVYPVGAAGNAITVVAADASDSALMPAIGVLAQDLLDEGEGKMIISGKIVGVNTSGNTAGDTAYVGIGGGWSNTPPTGEGNIVQPLGYFTRIDSSNGGGVVELGNPRSAPNLANGNILLGVDGGAPEPTTLSTTIVPEGTNLYYTTTRFDSDFGENTTDNLPEGVGNLYYTTSRVDSDVLLFVDSNYVQARQLTNFASELYVQNYVDSNITVAINNLVGGAPLALDTLNELAEALNDDANFASTITNQLNTKFDADQFDSSFDTRFSMKTTDDLREGSDVTNLYFSEARARASVSANGGISYDSNTGVFTLVGDIFNQVNFDSNFNVALSASTTDDLSEGSTNLYYTSTRVDSDILSLVDSAYVSSRVSLVSNASYEEYYFTSPVGGDTIFSGADENSDTLSYTPGLISVYLNGILLDSDEDYSAGDGSTITLTNPTDSSDVLQILSFTSNLEIAEYSYTASAAQTTVTGLDNNSRSLAYKVGYVEVYVNGVLLDPQVDYTATTGVSIVFTEALALNDFVQVFALTQFKDTDPLADYQDFYFSVDSAGQKTITGLDSDGELLQYRVGALKVFNNGVLVNPQTDYNAIDGVSVNFTTGLDSSDKIQIQAFNPPDTRPSYEEVIVSAGILVGGTNDSYRIDQYRNSTFTPTVEGQTSAGTATYTTQAGHYTRIGNCVNFTLQVSWTGHTGTGNLLVKGLPFTSLGTTGLDYVFPVSTNGTITYTNYDTLISKLQQNSTSITLHTEDGVGNVAQITIPASGTVLISGQYFIS